MRSILLLLIPAIAGCASPGAEPGAVDTEGPATRYEPAPIPLFYDRTDSSTIRFKDGVEFETGLYDLEYHGQVQRHGALPWLIMAGRHCQECDADLALYVHSPSDGPLISEFGTNARYHPGRILDGETGEPWYQARTFFGEVLAETGGVIWYERILHADGTIQEVTTLLDLDGEIPVESQFMDQERLPRTLELMSRGLCREIPGRDQFAAP
jgi:hypothetical protein